MNIVRPVKQSDLEGIYTLSKQTKAGLSTLPSDKGFLEERINASVKYFQSPAAKPGGEDYLFVMENTQTNEIIGTAALFSKVGGFEPFYTYEIKTHVNESKDLNVKKEIQYLQLKVIHNGPSEIGTLFLSPEHRVSNNGRLLSLSRFMFVAGFRQCFEETLLAEMRGVIDENGRTIFWEALGNHFFDIPFEKADLMAIKNKQFIADLMPPHPIYIPLLPKEAQLVIGQVHPQTSPARHLLEQEGFAFGNEVDIFEAGPVLSVKTDEVRSIKASCLKTVSEISNEAISSRVYMVANAKAMLDYRVSTGHLCFDADDGVVVSKQTAEAIAVKVGDQLRIVPIRIEEKR